MTGYGDAAQRMDHQDPTPVVTRQGGVHLVRLAGEIDLATADALGERVLAETTDARAVLLDLSSVGFLDSAGVRMLDGLIGTYQDGGRPVRVLVGPRGPVRLTLMLCAFPGGLIMSDAADALRALGG